MSTSSPVSIAVVGAGPAGIYTADIITKQFAKAEIPVSVDLLERLPVPFGLVRYGVAPDHPRIRAIIESLHSVLDRGDIRLVAGVEVGVDISVETIREAYDGVVLSTGANADAPLDIPGVGLPGSFGASEFISWYDAHPDASSSWALDAEDVAVIGAGNVALDITRMLTKPADDLVVTEIPDHVYEVLRSSRITDVHLFARRGPAEAQFTPMELRELDQIRDVDVVVDPDDMVFDRSSEALMASFKQRKLVAETLVEWSERDSSALTASRRIHLHFMQAPARIEGAADVEGLTVERTRHLPNGTVEGAGELRHWPVGQVYRAVGYASAPVPDVPFDTTRRTVPHDKGRVLGEDGDPIPGLYVSGWIKRGPVGLIGSTKSDGKETVRQLLEDIEQTDRAVDGDRDPLQTVLGPSGAETIDWNGWLRIDEHERARGEERGRERIKVYSREQLAALALGQAAAV